MNTFVPYAAVICPVHNRVEMDKAEYMRQLSDAHSLWKCPKCRLEAQFDDDHFEELHLKQD